MLQPQATPSVEHSKSVDGKLFHAEDGSLWLVQQGRSERVIFRDMEPIGQPMCVEVGVKYPHNQQECLEASLETMAYSGSLTRKHFKVSTNERSYTNLGSLFVEAGMYSICIGDNGCDQLSPITPKPVTGRRRTGKKRLKKARSIHVGDTLHMVDNKANTYWQGVVETAFNLATAESSFYRKSEVDAVRRDRGLVDWNSLDDGEMVMSVLWTKENLTEELFRELKKVINQGWNAVTIKPIDTTAIEEVLTKF